MNRKHRGHQRLPRAAALPLLVLGFIGLPVGLVTTYLFPNQPWCFAAPTIGGLGAMSMLAGMALRLKRGAVQKWFRTVVAMTVAGTKIRNEGRKGWHEEN
jgi:hypothetical protein